MNLAGCGRNRYWPNFRHNSSIFLKELMQITKYLSGCSVSGLKFEPGISRIRSRRGYNPTATFVLVRVDFGLFVQLCIISMSRLWGDSAQFEIELNNTESPKDIIVGGQVIWHLPPTSSILFMCMLPPAIYVYYKSSTRQFPVYLRQDNSAISRHAIYSPQWLFPKCLSICYTFLKVYVPTLYSLFQNVLQRLILNLQLKWKSRVQIL
jgi:hypothetical protein